MWAKRLLGRDTRMVAAKEGGGGWIQPSEILTRWLSDRVP